MGSPARFQGFKKKQTGRKIAVKEILFQRRELLGEGFVS